MSVKMSFNTVNSGFCFSNAFRGAKTIHVHCDIVLMVYF